MKTWKRILALNLCLIMVLGLLPALAPAAEAAEPVAAEVKYNLLDLEVTVGSDESRLEDPDLVYDLFDEEENYTLFLEPDAYFPYEVQFTCNGVTESRWFETPEDTEVVGGHTFSVYSMSTGEQVAAQIGMTVNGVYVPAYPEPKEFTPYPQTSTYSLLPLEEPAGGTYTVDLTGFFWSELDNVELSALLPEGTELEEGTEFVWSTFQGNYTIENDTIEEGTTVGFLKSISNFDTLVLIVGSADQLDSTNKRYELHVEKPGRMDKFVIDAILEDGTVLPSIVPEAIPVSIPISPNERRPGYRFNVNLANWVGEEDMPVRYAFSFKDNPALDLDSLRIMITQDHVSPEGITTTIDRTTQGWRSDLSDSANGLNSSLNGSASGYNMVITRNGVIVEEFPFHVCFNLPVFSLVPHRSLLVTKNDAGEAETVDYHISSKVSGGKYDLVFELDTAASLDALYSVTLTMKSSHVDIIENNGRGYVKHAAVGDYGSVDAVLAQPDIKEQLFDVQGYEADYSGDGVIFTIVSEDDSIHKVIITVVLKDTDSDGDDTWSGSGGYYFRPGDLDPFFRVEGAEDYAAYVMPAEHDTDYFHGYQTVFLLDMDDSGGSVPVTEEEIVPEFNNGLFTEDDFHVYAGFNSQSGTVQKSGESTIPFVSGQPVQYSVTNESGILLKNYWVTFLTQQKGASLFVNGATNSAHKDEETGLPVREIFLTPEYDYKHEIFFANIGDEELTGLYVKLEDAVNVQLDPYWTIGDTTTLAPFTTVDKTTENGELWNVGKIRLIPTGTTGDISGKLTIGSANGGEVTMLLTGLSGTPRITTTSLVDGVKHVPYSTLIQSNSMYAANDITFEVSGGELPEGLSLLPDGEIYGVPQEAGEFEFTVMMRYEGGFADRVTYTLVIADNGNEAVWESTDTGYEVTIPVGELDLSQGEHTYILREYADQVFESQGEFDYFVDFWLDGEKLIRDVDYLAEEGSTKITIYAETFRKAGTGSHTIAAEFREGGTEDGALKRAAQNYIMEEEESVPVTPPSGGSVNLAPAPVVPTTGMPFYDVYQSAWYFHDVKWAYENGWMIGVSGSRFAPNEAVSQATIVTVLARMAEVDLTEYAENPYPSIPDGKWYTASAVWALENKLLPTAEFGGEGPIGRDHMAIMLVKYLKHLDVQVKRPANPMEFADGDQMSKEAEEAFQILHACGVFKGVGENRMEPASATTRAQFSALINRIDHLFDAE